MSDTMLNVNGKNILLSRALKYFNDQEKCQRKFSLTPKEYGKLLDKIIEAHNKQLKSPSTQRPLVPVPAHRPSVPAHPSAPAHPSVPVPANPSAPAPLDSNIRQQKPEWQQQTVFSHKPTWYDTTIPKDDVDIQQQNNNSALLDRRFFNGINPVGSAPVFAVAVSDRQQQNIQTPLRGGGAYASDRMFDLVNPTAPVIMSRIPTNTRKQQN